MKVKKAARRTPRRRISIKAVNHLVEKHERLVIENRKLRKMLEAIMENFISVAKAMRDIEENGIEGNEDNGSKDREKGSKKDRKKDRKGRRVVRSEPETGRIYIWN